MPDLERIQQLTPGTLSQQWYEDGAVVDPGSVTIGITRADGTVLVAAGTTTSGTTTAPRTYNLTTTHTALLDELKVTWTSTLKGTLVSYVEVVGGFLFSLNRLRSLKTGGSSTIGATYTAGEVADARNYAEIELERECRMTFVPRYTRVTVGGDGGATLLLSVWPVRTIRSVSLIDSAGASTTFTAPELAALRFQSGVLYNSSGWMAGYGNYVIGLEYGQDYPPPGATEAALQLAKKQIVRGPVDDRATQRPSEFGPINLATPGMFGSITGLPDVDAFIRANRAPAIA